LGVVLSPEEVVQLRFLWDKSTTVDDWSSSGVPHQWWDVYTNPVVTSYGRFDLQTSSYAVLLMADHTPAWREMYTQILDGLASRFPTYWGAIDWLTQIGDDPKRAKYPESDMQLLPPNLRGRYNGIGWTANGTAPWGLQRDPIRSDGYLFFRGWFNLVLTIYKYVSGDNKWEKPFMVTGYGDEQFEWDHARIVDLLERQYTQHEAGPHCENTKVWFSCNSAATRVERSTSVRTPPIHLGAEARRRGWPRTFRTRVPLGFAAMVSPSADLMSLTVERSASIQQSMIIDSRSSPDTVAVASRMTCATGK
jgi:hypothetical protein